MNLVIENYCQRWKRKLQLLMFVFVSSGSVVAQAQDEIVLPEISSSGGKSLPQLLEQRRSVRSFQDRSLELSELGQLLWAAQGITNRQGFRTAPSAGALYPLELYAVVGQVEGLTAGIYRYDPEEHELIRTADGDRRRELARIAVRQTWIAEAPSVIVFTAVYERTTSRYGRRGERYVHMEVGHAAENLFLQAESLGLGAVVVGAFTDQQVADLLQLPEEEEPLLLMPVGHKARR